MNVDRKLVLELEIWI